METAGRIDEVYRFANKIANDRNPDQFDPRNITQSLMDKLADCIEEYADLIETCAVVQDNAPKDAQKALDEGLERVKKLIKKLRKGDRSVFKDEEDWNPLR